MEEVSGKWRLQKCKGSLKEGSKKRARSLRSRSYDSREKDCHCGDRPYKTAKAARRAQRQFGQSSNPRKYMHSRLWTNTGAFRLGLKVIHLSPPTGLMMQEISGVKRFKSFESLGRIRIFTTETEHKNSIFPRCKLVSYPKTKYKAIYQGNMGVFSSELKG